MGEVYGEVVEYSQHFSKRLHSDYSKTSISQKLRKLVAEEVILTESMTNWQSMTAQSPLCSPEKRQQLCEFHVLIIGLNKITIIDKL